MNNTNNNYDENLWTYHQTDNAVHLTEGYSRQDMLLRKVNKFIKKGKVLEIGFGDGYLLKKMSNKYNCYGADISKENINQMTKNIPDVKFSLIDITGRLPYDDNFFDGFIASEVLEHMSDEELILAVDEIKRVLRPGGVGFVTFPANEKLSDNTCFCPNCKTVFHKWGHKQSWNINKIKKVFIKFDIIKLKQFFSPYRGENFLEKVLGLGMWLARTGLNNFITVPQATYLVILRKRK